MALSVKEKQEIEMVLKRTGGHRESGKTRDIPESYRRYRELTVRQEIIVEAASAGVPVRCYTTTAKEKDENCPLHVNMHGGGFIFLQDEDDDLYCAHLAAEIHGIVVDIDYASSLEHPYPVAFEQSYEVMRWVFAHCREWGADEKKVSMGGHSAGGCLAAAIALKAAVTKDFLVCLQVLDYAAIDNYAAFLEGGSERSQAFSRLYADGDMELLKHPYVSPAYAAAGGMAGQPRTLIVNAGSCPFCMLNEAYGMRLIEAGTEVKMRRFVNSRHGFTVRMVDEWEEAQELIIREILDACTTRTTKAKCI